MAIITGSFIGYTCSPGEDLSRATLYFQNGHYTQFYPNDVKNIGWHQVTNTIRAANISKQAADSYLNTKKNLLSSFFLQYQAGHYDSQADESPYYMLEERIVDENNDKQLFIVNIPGNPKTVKSLSPDETKSINLSLSKQRSIIGSNNPGSFLGYSMCEAENISLYIYTNGIVQCNTENCSQGNWLPKTILDLRRISSAAENYYLNIKNGNFYTDISGSSVSVLASFINQFVSKAYDSDSDDAKYFEYTELKERRFTHVSRNKLFALGSPGYDANIEKVIQALTNDRVFA